MIASAERLEGIMLEGGWTVKSIVPKTIGATGGNFSVCYLVENVDGRKAFLKALDYSRALMAPDPAIALQALTEAFLFERDVLNKCRDARLDHVVVAIGEGKVIIPDAQDGGVVQYLIFELADGDVRRQATINQRFDEAWWLRSLHHVAIGIQQLHHQGIAHQDIKPSNVLIFNGNKSKIADFGRSAYRGHTPPHEDLPVAGDPAYAPPELLYGFVDSDWSRRRFGCDAYLLGSLAVFFTLGTGTTPLLCKELPEEFNWNNWRGSFEDVLPYLNNAFQSVLVIYRQSLPEPLRNDLSDLVEQLCVPDPRLRGDPKKRVTDQFSMERYISRFDILARYAELNLFHMLPL